MILYVGVMIADVDAEADKAVTAAVVAIQQLHRTQGPRRPHIKSPPWVGRMIRVRARATPPAPIWSRRQRAACNAIMCCAMLTRVLLSQGH